jgi:moderate conductance mechanosensitive channel
MCGHSGHGICQGKRLFGLAGLAIAILLVAAVLAKTVTCGALAAETATAEKTTSSPKVRALMTALAQEWLKEQGVENPAAPPAQQTGNSFEDYVNSDADAILYQMVALAGAIPGLPHEFEQAAARVTAIDADSGRGQVFLELGIFGDPFHLATRRRAAETQGLLDLAIFGACGLGAIWLFRKMTGRAQRRLDGLPTETVKDRLRAIAARFVLAFGAIAAFALGGLGPLLGIDWDPARRETMLSFLIVFVAIWIGVATSDLLLAPDDQRFRIIPMDTVAARFWCRRLALFAGWFAFVSVIIQECSALNFSYEGVQLVGYTLGLGVVAIALEAVWRRPIAPRGVAEATSAETHHFGRGAANIALSIGIVVMWVCWVAAPGVTSVRPLFWLVLVLILLPPAITVSRRAVDHLLRPAGSSQTASPPSVLEVTLEHGIRARS